MKRNAIVAQSGGPSPVINASLRGVIDACRDFPDTIDTLYAGWHGIEGVLREELLDLSIQSRQEIELLNTTPAAGAIGTCRYKLKSHQAEDFSRVVDVLKAHDIGYFFYNGGNDSMDTAHKIAKIAHEQGIEVISTGVPKTIDNDVGDSEFKLIDHTPGYGSTARYWAYIVQNANEENQGSCPADPVLILQAMGRKIGYIPAAARLADPERHMPLQIYMAESGHTLESMAENVNRQLLQDGRCIIVVSEGFNAGDLGEVKDSFGHTEFGASQMTVAQKVVNYLNAQGLPVPGKARCQVPGTDQRSMSIYASVVDIGEAYQVGRKAVEIAVNDGNGWMSTILRTPGSEYTVYYDKVPLEQVANSERTFPKEWITADGLDVTNDFLDYANPLIGEEWPEIPLEAGLQRYTRFEPVFAEKKLADYTPQAYR
jgi:6-phosphofructokinase 1